MNYSLPTTRPSTASWRATCTRRITRSIAPDFASVATYDALQAIIRRSKPKGQLEPKDDAARSRLKFESPRGPIEIDARTRDIVQNIYIGGRKSDGKYQNTEIATYPQVHDPSRSKSGAARTGNLCALVFFG